MKPILWRNWLGGKIEPSGIKSEKTQSRFRPCLEVLEGRWLLSGGVPSPPVASAPDPNLSALSPAVPQGPSTFASEQEWQQYLIDQAVAQWKSLLGTTVQGNYYPYNGPWRTMSGLELAVNDAAPAGSYSTTNVQVAGVDEADLVKTDGAYIYVLSGDVLDIVKAWPATSLDIASHTTIEGQPIGLYLSGSRLTVISNVGAVDPYTRSLMFGALRAMGGAAQVMALPAFAVGVQGAPVMDRVNALPPNPVGQGAGYNYQGPMLKVTVFDVSNPGIPEVVQESYVDGSYVDSRAIGNQVYLVAENNMTTMPAPLIQQNGTSYSYETEADYRARLSALPVDQFVPQIYTKNAQGQLQATGPLTAADHIYKPDAPGANQFVTVMVFDVMSDQPGPVDSIAVASNPTTVYANLDHLYLVSAPGFWGWEPQETSLIQKFSLSGDTVALTASGSVPGQITQWPNGQFSLDEQNGYLRIATSNDVNGSETSNIYVLGQFGNDLNIVGSLEDIAPGEKIFAVQFIGDHGFVVTFHSFDPLFTVDLSDPTSPRIIGSLQVPGVSRYIQAIDPNHIVGFGLDVNGGEGSDLQLSLYDVSNLSQPVLVDHYVITTGLWAVYSNVFDHHAFGYYPEYQTLAIPTLTSIWSNGASSLFVFQIDPNSGFGLTGQIQQDGVVERSLRIEDQLYSISTQEITVHSISDPTATVAHVALPGDGSGWGYSGGGPVGIVVPGGAAWWREPVFVDPPHTPPSHIPPGTTPPVGQPSESGPSNPAATPLHSDNLSFAFGIVVSSTVNAATPIPSSPTNPKQSAGDSWARINQVQAALPSLAISERSDSNDSLGLGSSNLATDEELDADPANFDFASPPSSDVVSSAKSASSDANSATALSFGNLWESKSVGEACQSPGQSNESSTDVPIPSGSDSSAIVGDQSNGFICSSSAARPRESFWGVAAALILLFAWPTSIYRQPERTKKSLYPVS